MKAVGWIALALVLCGCVGQSSADQHSKAQEFSGAGFEREMIKAGKQKELDEAKKREEAYLRAGQPLGGSESQEGPVNAGGQ